MLCPTTATDSLPVAGGEMMTHPSVVVAASRSPLGLHATDNPSPFNAIDGRDSRPEFVSQNRMVVSVPVDAI